MKNLWEKYGAKLIAFLILAVIVIGVISVIAIFDGFIMRFFGFEYKSIGSIIGFFLLATILSYPIGLFATAIPNVLLNEFHRISLKQAYVLYVFFDTIATAIGLSIVDMFMESVSATNIAIFVVSFLSALYSVKDDIKINEE
ncbi:MAG: hypothetical protein IJO60_11445 [Agathobacter sp.]|nr:hypothetical protein [Agathobacter sp.]